MILIRDTEAKLETAIERAEFVQLLNAAICHNIDDIERLEKTTFGDIVKDSSHPGMVDTCLMNHYDNWKFCIDRRDKINAIEADLGLKD